MMRFSLLPATCLASLLLLTGSASAQTVFSIDDGVAESGLGTGGGNTLAYLNSFTGGAGTTQIDSIQIVLGLTGESGLSVGMPVTAYLWSDPNGDGSPTDATVLGSVTGTMASPHTGAFETFTFASPVTLTSDNFFVGFTFTNTGSSVAAGVLDTSNPLANRSYFALTSGSLDPNNLGGGGFPVGTIESFFPGSAGNWLIHATAIPEPSTYAACFGAAALGLVLLRRRGQRR